MNINAPIKDAFEGMCSLRLMEKNNQLPMMARISVENRKIVKLKAPHIQHHKAPHPTCKTILGAK